MKKFLFFFALSFMPLLACADAVEIDGIYYNLITKTKTAEVTSNPNEYTGIVNIPASVINNGVEYVVTDIGYQAFYRCFYLTSITIPGSVTNIGDRAFFGCKGLTSITIPNSVTKIGDDAFSMCIGLTSVTIPNSVTKIGDGAFANCSGLTSVTIPSSVTSIGDSVFLGCSGLTSVTIPNSVTTIGNGTFGLCSRLTSVTIPNSVTSIGPMAFQYCSGLTSVTIGNGVMSIGNRAFDKCSSLASITIGSSVKNIDYQAFASIWKLNNVYCLANDVPSTSSDVFEDSYANLATLHVPESSINNFKATEPWSTFKSIVSLTSNTYYTLTYMVDGDVYKTYKLAAGSTITPEPEPTKTGYTFSGWSEIPKTMPEHDVTVYGTFTKNVKTYTLTISATGNGYASYSGTTIRNKTSAFTLNEGTNATITFSPDNGYRIKSVKVGSTDVTASVSNNRYTVSNIQGNKTVSVVFEAIPPTTYTLTISATGNGYASYNGTTIRNKTTTFTVNEGTNATITFSPDNGYRIKSVKVGSSDVTASVSNNRYTVSNIQSNKTVEIVFEAIIKPGDANNDGLVSVTDVGCATNYILEQAPSVFVFEAADMNGDNSVSVTDVGMIINLILSEGAASRTGENVLEANYQNGHNSIVPRVSLTSTADGYKLMLEQKDAFIGFQFDVELAENATINGMQLADDDEHVIICHRLSNGKWRVVCYSPTNSTFNADETALLTFATTGDVMISDMRLTTTGLDELRPAAIFGTTTGITNVKQDMKISVDGHTLRIFSVRDTTLRIVSMGGAYRTLKVKDGENCFESLRAGVYMINNQKVILR